MREALLAFFWSKVHWTSRTWPPPEYFRTDKFDPYQADKYPTYPSVPFTIVGDLLDPVYPSPHSHREIEQYIENLSTKIKAPNQLNPLLITRAVRDVNNGHPLNPQNEKSWSQAVLSLTAELAGNYIADADKSALDTSHAVFANILDPGYLYPGDSSVCRMEFSTPLARFSHSTAPTRDILETPCNTSMIGDDPAALVSRKMGRDVYPFPSPSTVSSTPSWASTLAMECIFPVYHWPPYWCIYITDFMATMHLSVTDENWVYFPGLSLTTLLMYLHNWFYGNDAFICNWWKLSVFSQSITDHLIDVFLWQWSKWWKYKRNFLVFTYAVYFIFLQLICSNNFLFKAV